MLPILVLAHAALGTALVLTHARSPAERSRAVTGAGLLGAASALLLFLVAGSDGTWGTLSLQQDRAVAAAAAVFSAWMLVIATDDGRGRWEAGALVGAGSTALIGFALNDWIAPALLFWVCLSLATAVAGSDHTRSTKVVIGLSDACVVGALATWAVGEETWRMPEALEGGTLVLAIAGIALRAGIAPRVGLWELARGGNVALIPLLVGSVFGLVPSLSAGDEVAVALPFLLAGMLAALWCAIRSPQVVLVAGWVVATMLALAFVQPQSLGKAAAAAALAATATLLWPWTGGRAGPERGLLVALVPLTVGFGPIVGAATVSFERSSAAESVLSAAPWTAFAALLPAALAVGVTMGAAIARRAEPETYRPAAVLATWAIGALALLLGLTGAAQLGLDLGAELWLYVVAASLAVGASRFAPRQPVFSEVSESGPALGLFVLPPSVSKVAEPAGMALIGAVSIGALWFTFVGLRTGFL